MMLTLVVLLTGPNTFASMARDTSLDGASIDCTTEGVGPFVRHTGGYSFRVDGDASRPSLAKGTFWEVLPMQGDSLFTRGLGSEAMNVVVKRDAGGQCRVLLNQVNDVDGNQMDISIPVGSGKRTVTNASISMRLHGKPIRPEHGKLTCNVNPDYYRTVLAAKCGNGAPPVDPKSDSPYYEPGSTATGR